MTLSDAGERIQKLLIDTIISITRIKVFRSTNRDAVGQMRMRIEQEARKQVEELYENGFLSVDLETARESFGRLHADHVIRDCSVITEAATLVFAHTLLDLHVSECLGILINANPLHWADKVKDKQVTIERLRADGVEGIVLAEVDRYKRRILKEAIITRIDELHRYCRPTKVYVIHKEPYTYDRGRIKVFDGKRHGIIHEADITVGEYNLDSEFEYVERTCIYLSLIVGDALKAEWNLERAVAQHLADRAKSSDADASSSGEDQGD